MAQPVKYPRRRMVRNSTEVDDIFIQLAKKHKVKISAEIRTACEEYVKNHQEELADES